MLRAERPLLDPQRSLVQGLRRGKLLLLRVKRGEVGERHRNVGVLLTQLLLPRRDLSLELPRRGVAPAARGASRGRRGSSTRGRRSLPLPRRRRALARAAPADAAARPSLDAQALVDDVADGGLEVLREELLHGAAGDVAALQGDLHGGGSNVAVGGLERLGGELHDSLEGETVVASLGEAVLGDELVHDGEPAEHDAPDALRSHGLHQRARHQREVGARQLQDGLPGRVPNLGVRVAELLDQLRHQLSDAAVHLAAAELLTHHLHGARQQLARVSKDVGNLILKQARHHVAHRAEHLPGVRVHRTLANLFLHPRQRSLAVHPVLGVQAHRRVLAKRVNHRSSLRGKRRGNRIGRGQVRIVPLGWLGVTRGSNRVTGGNELLVL
mmetsp:Transcript_9589/g.37412  ORF Transcript_9589/g.37412 Transcript_9589/m.37412 type:complete len:384 (+) Transcript_9589:307-1458(+)